jgi:UDP-N-acetylmuramate dehydrogenase
MISWQFLYDIGISTDSISFDAPFGTLTWFKTGGTAKALLRLTNTSLIPAILQGCHQRNIPVFFWGDGSNLLVSDSGFDGLVIDTKTLLPQLDYNIDTGLCRLSSGLLVKDVVMLICDQGLQGLEYFYGLPGTVGGAVFMNARCYDHEWSDIFVRASIIYHTGQSSIITYDAKNWSYKKSPFQEANALIEWVEVQLIPGADKSKLRDTALICYQDRESKGHFRAPCAGSFFKNNRSFGHPTGKLIENMGLKGYSFGGAQVAPWHGNILINANQATATDIYQLCHIIQERAQAHYQHQFEPEVIFLGNFVHALK